ncbi:MAG: AAA family ATPase [Deltaproteobacteria bacterium]|nr:AAA family ATPase [Deltaproteobacteria bacterium]
MENDTRHGQSQKDDAAKATDRGQTVLKPLPSSNSSFSKLIDSDHVYIDKTSFIHDLLTGPDNSIFLARPRGFGKTLLLASIEAVVQGRKDLFADCIICNSKSNFDWKKSHVVRLDMSVLGDNLDNIDETLTLVLHEIAKLYGISLGPLPCHLAIQELITTLFHSYNDIPLISEEQKITIDGTVIHADSPEVAVLIDESDYPLISSSLVPDKRDSILKTLAKFYMSLKKMNQSGLLRFLFITGITKFKGSFWLSGMNAIRDISFLPKYSKICGFTIPEIKSKLHRHAHIASKLIRKSLPAKSRYTIKDFYEDIMKWYGGYSWDGSSKVLNPRSVIEFMKDNIFSSHWHGTSTSTFLNRLNIHDPDYFRLYAKNLTCEERISRNDLGMISASTALLMAGYLTIKESVFLDVPNGEEQFILGIPNTEVMESFAKEHRFDSIFKNDSISLTNEIIFRFSDFTRYLSNLETDRAGNALSSLLALIPTQSHKSEINFSQTEINAALIFFKGEAAAVHGADSNAPDFVLYHVNGDIYVVKIKNNKTSIHIDPLKPETKCDKDDNYTGVTGQALAKSVGTPPPDRPPVTPTFYGQTISFNDDNNCKAERETIRKLLDKGIKDAFDQLFCQSYAAGFLSPRYKVYAIAISIVNSSEALVDCREVTYGDWRYAPRPTPLSNS